MRCNRLAGRTLGERGPASGLAGRPAPPLLDMPSAASAPQGCVWEVPAPEPPHPPTPAGPSEAPTARGEDTLGVVVPGAPGVPSPALWTLLPAQGSTRDPNLMTRRSRAWGG